MGLGDFLKNAADKAAKKVQEVSQAVSESAKEAAERQKQRQAEQEEARKAERDARIEASMAEWRAEKEQKQKEDIAACAAEQEARRKKLEHYKSLAPTCEKGDCAMSHEYFYYSCPDDCECRRKRLVDKSKQYVLPCAGYMPYMKWIEDLTQKIMQDEGSTEDQKNKTIEIHIPWNAGDYRTISINCFDEAAMTFLENFSLITEDPCTICSFPLGSVKA